MLHFWNPDINLRNSAEKIRFQKIASDVMLTVHRTLIQITSLHSPPIEKLTTFHLPHDYRCWTVIMLRKCLFKFFANFLNELLFVVELYKLFLHSLYQTLIRDVVCKYFLLFCRLSFYFLGYAICCTKVFNFDEDPSFCLNNIKSWFLIRNHGGSSVARKWHVNGWSCLGSWVNFWERLPSEGSWLCAGEKRASHSKEKVNLFRKIHIP